MNRKIRASLMGVSVLCVLLAAAVLTLIFFRFYEARMFAAVDSQATLINSAISIGGDTVKALDALGLSRRDDRVTLIGADGTVLFDSYEPADKLENHGNREEVRGAFLTGSASANRFSETLNKQTYYSAVRTEAGQVLRVAKTMDSIIGVFMSVIMPVALVVLAVWIVSLLLSTPVTRWIIAPINNLDITRGDRPVYEELSPLIKRISDQNRQIEEQITLLRNRASTMEAIAKDMREGLIILSEKMGILSANASALKLFGAKEAPENLVELSRNRDIVERARRAVAGQNGHTVFEAGGRVIQAYFSPVRHEFGDGAILLFMDITERANAEQIRREFSANVSHELKTPLTVIAGLAEMLCAGMARPEDALPFAEKISAETARLQALIEDIIKLSELDEGVNAETESFGLLDLAQTALEALRPLAEAKGIAVRAEGEDIVISAQRERINEMLTNLIGNGITYNKPGGELTVTVDRHGGRARVRVRDTGIGIPKDKLARVFERFYRVDSSRSKQTGGTGLGLSIVKHIALIHGGSVEIVSEEGVYTEVSVTI